MRKNSSSICFAILFLSLGCTNAYCDDAKPSVESFFNDPTIRSVILSPEGHYVAILEKINDNKQAIVVFDTSDLSKHTIAVTAPEPNEINSINWVNEEKITYSVRFQNRTNTNKYVTDRDGSNHLQLISGDWRFKQQVTGSNIKSKILPAEYTYFSKKHDGSDDIIVKKNKFNSIDMQSESTRLYTLNTKTQLLTELASGLQPAHIFTWILDKDDVARIVVSHSAGKCITFYRAPESENWTEISNVDCYEGAKFNPVFFGSGGTLFVTSNYKGYNALYRYNLTKLQMEADPLIAIDGFDFIGTPEYDYVEHKVLGFHYLSDAGSTVWFDHYFKNLQEKVDAILPKTINHISCGSNCLTSTVVLIKSDSDRQPLRFYLYTPTTGTMQELGGALPEIVPEQMGTRSFTHFAARDGLSIPVYVTMPAKKTGAPMPTVVLVHGGPNVRGSSWEWDSEAQFLASRGYVVIQPEFRGSTGFGYAHFKAGWRQWGLNMQTDLADAALWSIHKGWSDPKRIAIMGASYGGYATLMGLIKNPELFHCGIEWSGVTDMNMMFTSVDSDASQDALNYDMKTLIGDPVADAAMFSANSPVANADKLTQPILIAHGVLDRRVPIAHAIAFKNAVSAVNNHVEWIDYLDEGHGWYFEKDRVDFWKHVDSFLEKNL